MKNIANMLKQAQQMQAKVAEMQAQLDQVEMTGASGAGLVQVTLTGKGMMRKIKIDKSLLDPNESEVLEDLDHRRLQRGQAARRGACRGRDGRSSPAGCSSRAG